MSSCALTRGLQQAKPFVCSLGLHCFHLHASAVQPSQQSKPPIGSSQLTHTNRLSSLSGEAEQPSGGSTCVKWQAEAHDD